MAKYKTDIVLGARYRDTVSDWEGIATAVHFYMNGCVRVSIDSKDRHGKPEGYVLDEEQVELVETETLQAEKAKARHPSGGPRDNTPPDRP